MTVAKPSLDDLRAQAAETQAALAQIPIADILKALRNDLRSPEILDLLAKMKPLVEAIPGDHPMKQHAVGVLGALSGLPVLIDQNLLA